MATLNKPFGLSLKAIVRNREGKILVLKRSETSTVDPGRWDLPGGKADRNETFDQALLREVTEETGLDITLERMAGAYQFELPEWRVVNLIMEGRLEGGEVRLSPEHTAFRWIDPRKMSTLDLVEHLRGFTGDWGCGQYGNRIQGV